MNQSFWEYIKVNFPILDSICNAVINNTPKFEALETALWQCQVAIESWSDSTE